MGDVCRQCHMPYHPSSHMEDERCQMAPRPRVDPAETLKVVARIIDKIQNGPPPKGEPSPRCAHGRRAGVPCPWCLGLNESAKAGGA